MGNLTMSDQKVSVEMQKDANGLEKVVLKEPRGASAQVYLFGGHVTSWKNDRGEDVKIWPHSFEFRLRVVLAPGGDLTLISRIRNTDSKPFTFTFAYHTYFSVSDISEVPVEGLETLDYLDNLQNKERFTEQGDAITFESEVDRIYLSTPTKIAIIDHEKKRTFVLKKDGLADAVVWNPWERKAKAMVDFGDDEYKHMLCIEAAAVEKPITLKPGEEWKGRQELSAVPSSYFSGQLDPQKVLQG
uniref:glucose-6-phosphate 1-epimerase n=1 Tax=Picea sitchensis TaxID=3332 RepID=A9NT43_PICSI|nr:unknown [Picea sitchensis]